MVEVMDLIKRLPKDYAEVILLRVVADLDVNDVAEIVGKEPGNVASAHSQRFETAQ